MPKVVIITLNGPGQVRLAGRSGHTSEINHSAAQSLRMVELQPRVGESDDVIDLGLKIQSGHPR